MDWWILQASEIPNCRLDSRYFLCSPSRLFVAYRNAEPRGDLLCKLATPGAWTIWLDAGLTGGQVWFQDETFRSGVYACQPPSLGDVDVCPPYRLPAPSDESQSSPLFQLQLLFSFLQTARQAVYNPVTLVSALKLDTGEQQDAQEFSKLFMNLLDQQFKKQSLLDDRVGGVKVKRLVEEQVCHII